MPLVGARVRSYPIYALTLLPKSIHRHIYDERNKVANLCASLNQNSTSTAVAPAILHRSTAQGFAVILAACWKTTLRAANETIIGNLPKVMSLEQRQARPERDRRPPQASLIQHLGEAALHVLPSASSRGPSRFGSAALAAYRAGCSSPCACRVAACSRPKQPSSLVRLSPVFSCRGSAQARSRVSLRRLWKGAAVALGRVVLSSQNSVCSPGPGLRSSSMPHSDAA